ncbi:MAG: polysaccharide deacetylase family protein [Ruminococcus sp.]|nr:polysaccharide deacetylase family protein [Ruminococcus sp.]
MYRCYNPKRFLRLLLVDVVAIAFLMVFLQLGKLVFSADAPKDGVFLPVVMYHSVTPETVSEYQVSAEMFRRDLQYLSENGYETVSAAQLVDYTNGKGELPAKPIMLTFDDGFYNNLSIALPLLEEFDMCAVVSVVGKYTDVNAANDPHSDVYSYLTWEDIRMLQESGRVEIGSHTYDLHSMEDRAGCSIMFGENTESYTALLTNDLQRLQNRMAEETGMQPTVFAYPYGYICKESIPVLKKLGFVCSFTCYERPNYITRNPSCLFGIDRYNRSGNITTEEFFKKLLEQKQ